MASESNVYDLFDGRPPSEPVDTSMMAALEALPNVGKQHRAVLDLLHRRGSNGATDDELEVALRLSHQAVSARRRELVLKGLVRDSGRRRATRRGRQATVWEMGLDLTAEGSDGSPMVHVPTPAEIRLALRDMRRMWKAAREAGVGPSNPHEVAKVGSWLRAVAGEPTATKSKGQVSRGTQESFEQGESYRDRMEREIGDYPDPPEDHYDREGID